MKFQLYRALNYKPNCEEMLEKYPVLANYNFKVDKSGNSYVTITSIKQLKQFVKDIGQVIILFPDSDGIEIYDGYRE